MRLGGIYLGGCLAAALFECPYFIGQRGRTNSMNVGTLTSLPPILKMSGYVRFADNISICASCHPIGARDCSTIPLAAVHEPSLAHIQLLS